MRKWQIAMSLLGVMSLLATVVLVNGVGIVRSSQVRMQESLIRAGNAKVNLDKTPHSSFSKSQFDSAIERTKKPIARYRKDRNNMRLAVLCSVLFYVLTLVAFLKYRKARAAVPTGAR